MTFRQEQVMRVLADGGPLSANEVGAALGFQRGEIRASGRSLGPAQRVISSLTGLRRLGLVEWTFRWDDGSRASCAFVLTARGRAWVEADRLAHV